MYLIGYRSFYLPTFTLPMRRILCFYNTFRAGGMSADGTGPQRSQEPGALAAEKASLRDRIFRSST